MLAKGMGIIFETASHAAIDRIGGYSALYATVTCAPHFSGAIWTRRE
jgi:hypothetical protein